MPETAHYYLSRVVKGGLVTPDSVIGAITGPVTITRRMYSYTFTGIETGSDGEYVFGRLTKFLPAGEVEVVDPENHETGPSAVDNLQRAASPFVYIPGEAVVAYQHVWNQIPRESFEDLFGLLVEAKHEYFFATCHLEPISDLLTFVERIASLDRIEHINATVNPPNPLFGPLWDDLRQYMRERNVGQVNVGETAATSEGIHTRIPQIALRALRSPPRQQTLLEPPALIEPASVTDAAVFMAADGYGKARLDGEKDGAKVVVRTRETQVHFTFDKDPSPRGLFAKVRRLIAELNESRGLRHDK